MAHGGREAAPRQQLLTPLLLLLGWAGPWRMSGCAASIAADASHGPADPPRQLHVLGHCDQGRAQRLGPATCSWALRPAESTGAVRASCMSLGTPSRGVCWGCRHGQGFSSRKRQRSSSTTQVPYTVCQSACQAQRRTQPVPRAVPRTGRQCWQEGGCSGAVQRCKC